MQTPSDHPDPVTSVSVEPADAYRWLVEQNSRVALVLVNSDGLITTWNAGGERITGYSAAEAIGRAFNSILAPPGGPEVGISPLMDRARAAHDAVEAELSLARKDGTPYRACLAVTAIRNPAATVTGFAATLRALDQQAAMDQQRRDTEARHRAIFETAVDAIITIDDRGTMESANPAAQRLFGHALAEMVGQNVSMLMPSPDRDRHDQYLANYLQTGQRKIIGIGREVVGLRKDGSTFPMDLAVSEMNIAGRRMFTGLIRDVSERRRAEREREQLLERERAAREQAERANRAKDEFLAVLSHELRTPLTPVLLAVSAMEVNPDLSPDMKEDVQAIRRGVELEARLIDDLLDLTRIARGRFQLHRRPSNLHSLIFAAYQVCHREGVASVALQLEARECVAEADPARFQQVVWNLLNNAYKFTPSDGMIAIRTTNPAPGMMRLEIRDSGMGIDPRFLTRIFTAFEQGDPSHARRVGGLGLGLAIARAIVDAHGGTIGALSSGIGKGATFFVEWPGVRAPGLESAAPATPAPAAAPARNLRILLVEDHALTLAVLTRMLRGLGHEVIAASRLAEAIEKARGQRFDLLVSDIGLPDGTGLDLVRWVKTQSPVPAIAVSGYGTPDDLARSREAGFALHLIKPVDARQLQAAIDQVGVAGTA